MSDEQDAIDETGADGEERQAKEELSEAIDHFKNAASILFERASRDPAVKTAEKTAERVGREAEKVIHQIGDAAEPIARQLAGELGKLTKSLLHAVEGKKDKSSDSDSEE